ncbi:hypothetical protein [Streptomyces sp. NPDC088554]|uniref:hypothetical protein n=1 Tax=Streptomyces sp. NPDC088554 TaxID=3365865 RepID=UPI0037FBCBC3
MIRRRLKFTVVLLAVVLALTGFQSSKGKSGGSRGKGSSSSGSGSSGGGCSNSKKNNGAYSGAGAVSHHDDDSGSDSGSTGGGSTYTTAPTSTTDGVEARVITCVRKAKGKRKAVTYATVRVEADQGPMGVYEVDVTFRDAAGRVVDSAEQDVALAGGETRTLQIPMDTPRKVTRVRDCEAVAVLDS